MRIDLYHHIELPSQVLEQFNKLHNHLDQMEIRIMASLDETLAAVTAEDTKVDSIIAFLAGIKKQLDDALVGTVLPPAAQAKIDQIFAQATASAGKIDTAIAANTPAAPAG